MIILEDDPSSRRMAVGLWEDMWAQLGELCDENRELRRRLELPVRSYSLTRVPRPLPPAVPPAGYRRRG